ncbi:hypothetical protein BU041_11645, partial [Staphylococcus simulans]
IVQYNHTLRNLKQHKNTIKFYNLCLIALYAKFVEYSPREITGRNKIKRDVSLRLKTAYFIKGYINEK